MANCNMIFQIKKTYTFYILYFLIRFFNKKWVYSILKNYNLVCVYHNGRLMHVVKVKDMQP